MTFIKTVMTTAALLLSAGALADRNLAEPGDPGPLEGYMKTGESESCVFTPRISRTDVIDGQTILFHMGRRDVYMNRLPRNCPGLARERAFTYTIRGSQLCSLDIIRVIETPAMRMLGAACGLGKFERLAVRADFEAEEYEYEFEDESEVEAGSEADAPGR